MVTRVREPVAPGAAEPARPEDPAPGTGTGPAVGTGVAAEQPTAEQTRTAKSEQTRTLIVETALRLFREHGYDRTTMRAIAREAGVSVGNAYYYFDSKEHLVQGFYDRVQALHREAAAHVLATERDFGARLRGTL